MGERECGLRTGNERVSLVEGECENCCMNLGGPVQSNITYFFQELS